MFKKFFPQNKSIDCLINSSSHRKIHAYVINGVKSDSGPSIGVFVQEIKKNPHSKSLSDCYVIILNFKLASPMLSNRDQTALGNLSRTMKTPSRSHHLLSYREQLMKAFLKFILNTQFIAENG